MSGESQADMARRLHESIALQESLRPAVGDRLVDEALDALHREQAMLDRGIPDADGEASLSALERKQVTAMFADLSGFTSMSERLDPEKMRAVLQACFEGLVGVIARYGGTVEKFIGDAIYAVFGAPVAHEDDPERACRTALDLMTELDAFNSRHGLDLGLHVGINSGLVVAGMFRARGHRQYVTTGDTVNVAARLEDRSETGEILVGPQTWRLTRHRFRYASAGAVKLKGKAEPLEVYRLLGARAVGEAPTQPLLESLPLVGRDDVVARMVAGYERLHDGKGAVLSVVGEAGLGKSRLLTELRARCAPRATAWLEAPCFSYTRAIPYHPLVGALRAHLSLSGEGPESIATLTMALASLRDEGLAEHALYVAAFLGCALADHDVEASRALEAEALRRQIFRACRALFAAIARGGPTVVVLDDLHWADTSTVELVEHILPLIAEVPLLFVLSSRPRSSTAVERLRGEAAARLGERCDEIELAPLTDPECARLMTSMLDAEQPALRLVEEIQRQSAGNPFFLAEITRALAEDGTLRRSAASGRWMLPASAVRVGVPDSLQGVIMARVDRLDDDARTVLKAVAVAGPTVTRDLLDALLPKIPDVGRHLDLVEDQQLLRLTGSGWSFVHPLCRDVVYDSISLQQRETWHRATAAFLETVCRAESAEAWGRLAWHHAEGSQWDKAQAFLVKAGDQAGRMAADSEALDCYARALEACQKAFGDEWDNLEHARLQRKMGEALFRRGDYQKAREHAFKARALLGRGVPVGTAAVCGSVMVAMGVHGFRQMCPPRPKRLDARQRAVLEELVRVSELLEQMEYTVDQQRYTFFALEHLATAEDLGLLDHQAISLSFLAIGCDIMGQRWLAGAYLRRAMALAEQSELPRPQALALYSLGMHDYFEGRLDEAEVNLTASVTRGRVSGDPHLWGSLAVDLAGLLFVRGRVREGLALSREMTRSGEDTADDQVVGWGRMLEGHFLRVLEGPERALPHLERADALLRAVPDPYFLPKVHGLMIECLVDQGALDRAFDVLEAAAAARKQNPLSSHFEGWLSNARARLRIALAERDGGAAWQLARAACDQAETQGRRSPGTLVSALCLRGAYQWARGQREVAGRQWQRAGEEAERTGDVAGAFFIAETVAARTGRAGDVEAARALRERLVGGGVEREAARRGGSGT